MHRDAHKAVFVTEIVHKADQHISKWHILQTLIISRIEPLQAFQVIYVEEVLLCGRIFRCNSTPLPLEPVRRGLGDIFAHAGLLCRMLRGAVSQVSMFQLSLH